MIDFTIKGLRFRLGREQRGCGFFHGFFVEKEGFWSVDIGVIVCDPA